MKNLDRRQFVAALAATPLIGGVAAAIAGSPAFAQSATFNTRPLRPAGEVPVIGIGTARNYAEPSDAEMAELRATLARFAEMGGKIVDTAPSYGRAEPVVGTLVADLGIRDRLYLATKVGADSLEEGRPQIEQSFANLKTDFIDLIAVHNLRDVTNHLAYLRDLRDQGRIGAIGMTTSSDGQYEEFERVLQREELDCIQVDYALDNRNAGQRILPMAQERNLPTMINLPFGRGRLFSATQGMPLPDWAVAMGAQSWAQVFLKYIISHPARPIAIPGTGTVRYAEDNLGAAGGTLPDAAGRAQMERFVDAL